MAVIQYESIKDTLAITCKKPIELSPLLQYEVKKIIENLPDATKCNIGRVSVLEKENQPYSLISGRKPDLKTS